MKQHKKRIILLISAIIVIWSMIWYQTPIRKNIAMSVCSVDGERIDVILDVSLQRYILGATQIKGTITLGDQVYYNYSTNVTSNNGFIEMMRDKINGDEPAAFFSLPPYTILENSVMLDMDKNTDILCLHVYENSNLTTYYGPAESAEEAKTLESTILFGDS